MSLGRVEDFALERYFAKWEFAVDHQLSASDVEPLRMRELLSLADGESRERWESLRLGYTESTGLPALKQEIATLYPGLTADDVLVLSGAEEGIFLVMQALLAPGDDAIVVTPAYQSLTALPTAIGARVRTVELRMERGWTLDPDEIAAAVTPATRLIAVNFPHNPTGAHIDEATQARLIGIAEQAGAVLLSDEVYMGLEHSAPPLAPAAALSRRAISLGVVSKSYALAGLRIGWIATRDPALLARVARLKDYTTICASAPSEVLALIALRNRAALLDRARAIVAGNVQRAAAFVEERRELLEWIPPRAGSTAFPRFRDRDAEALSQTLATGSRVLLLPGTVFGCDRSFFRLGLGRADFPEALATLANALR